MSLGDILGQDATDYEGHFANYAEYSKTYRSWMVAYGIGGPIFLLVSKDAPKTVSESPYLQTIITLFVLGVGLQILLALINKWAAWQMYRGAFSLYRCERGLPDADSHHNTRTYKVWHWINGQSWIDFLCDLLSLLAFSAATWLVLEALLGTVGA